MRSDQHPAKTTSGTPAVPSHSRLEQLLAAMPLPGFDVVTVSHPARPEVEAYIRERFTRAYGAEVREFLPWLLTLHCGGHLSAAAGLRPATAGRLLVERYLDRSIDRELAAMSGLPVRRSEVLEIGNLVSGWRGSSQLLMLLLPVLAQRLGYRWLVFTATAEVQKLIGRLRFSPFTLCRADGVRLGEDQAQWGSYYRTDPRVMAGYLPDACTHLLGHRLLGPLVAAYQPHIDHLLALLATEEPPHDPV